jgi:hypothetical protein
MKIDEILNSPFSFKQRKAFTPCETRPLWKCALIILIVGLTGREKKCSLKKIHTANWVIKSSEHLKDLIDWSQSNLLFPPNIRLDPFTDRAIELVAASGHVRKSSGKIELTPTGETFFEGLMANKEIMTQEKSSLKASKKYLSDSAIEKIFRAH